MSQHQTLTDRLLTLLRIPSVTGDETNITDHLAAWAQGRGLPSVRRGNALVIGDFDDARPRVALVGHTDTVPGSPTDAPPHLDGKRIVGLGASDMKGSLAVMQALFEGLPLARLPFGLLAIFYDQEEGPSVNNGLQPLLDHVPTLRNIDLAIAMEPTDGTLQLGCLGGFHARLTFVGKAAHSARPWQGDNAIYKAAPLLQALRTLPQKETVIEGLTFRDAVSVTLARGGRTRNVVPDFFELNLNYRYAPQSPLSQKEAAVRAHIAELAQGARVEIIDHAPAGPLPRDNKLFDHLRRVSRLPIEPKQAWTDVARLAAHGIDALNFGPGIGAMAHQAGEYIDVDAMARAYEVLEHFLSTPLD